jgi:flagellar biosynthetic protein FliO
MDVSYYIKFIISSLLVIGFLLLILKYSKKIQQTQTNKDIKILDRVALGSQSNIFLVEIKGAEYLIGATNQQISLIDKR